MATSSFDRKIELDELSAKRLKKVLNTKKKVEIEDIDVEEQLKEGKEIMALLKIFPTIKSNKIFINKWKGNKNRYQYFKRKAKTLLKLLDYRKNNPTIYIPFIDMLFDEEKRTEIYVKYDKNYQSTKEEDEIYNEMRGIDK